MINHVSLNAILCEIEKDSIFRNVKVIRSYKDQNGIYLEDIIPCVMWTKTNKNVLFSFKSGTLVSIDGIIENIDNKLCIVVEQITYLSNGDFNYRGS